MLYQDFTEERNKFYQMLYACREERSNCENLLPIINNQSPIKYFNDIEFIKNLLLMGGMSAASFKISDYINELLEDEFLRKRYVSAIKDGIFDENLSLGYDERICQKLLKNNVHVYIYIYIRLVKPSIIVETGTCSGGLSSIIVSALAKNNNGVLISIDLPPSVGKMPTIEHLKDQQVGYLIPYEYRDHWRLLVGDAKVILPQVMMENDVDIFFHDSLHTRTHMAFEYAVARTFLKEGGLIFSDDILFNNAFFKFIETHHLPAIGCVSNPQFAFCRNIFDEYERSIGLKFYSQNSSAHEK